MKAAFHDEPEPTDADATDADATQPSAPGRNWSLPAIAYRIVALASLAVMIAMVWQMWGRPPHQPPASHGTAAPGAAAAPRPATRPTGHAAESHRTAGSSGATAEADAADHGKGADGPSALEVPNPLQHGDELLREGDTAAAVREYERAQNMDGQHDRADIHYRLALSAESLGDLDRALNEYRTALGAAPEPALREVCQFGQVRVWLQLRRHDVAADLLADLWLTTGEEGRSAELTSQTVYALADTLVRQCVQEDNLPPWAEPGLLLPKWELEPLQRWIDRLRPRNVAAQPVPEGVQVGSRSGPGPVDVSLSVRLERLSLGDAVERVCRAAGFNVEWTPAAKNALVGRSVRPSVGPASLANLLDALMLSAELLWTCEGTEVRVFTEPEVSGDELRRYRHAAAQRAVTYAVVQHPDAEQAPTAYLSLGNLAMLDARIADAEGFYRQLLRQFPRAEVAVEAWFNLAKSQLRLGRSDEALEAFYHVVDGGQGHAVEPVAYLYIGRLVLESGDPKKAVTPLMRAAVLARGRDMQSLSTLALGTAYLMSGNPTGANLALMEHRDHFDGSPFHDQAAFLAAFARYRAAAQPGDREREGRAVLSALAHVTPGAFFGKHAWYLIGQAYDEIGLPDRAAQTYAEALRQSPAPPYREAMAYALAEWLALNGQLDETARLLSELAEEGRGQWRVKARLRLGRLQLVSGRLDAALELGRSALPLCDTDQEKVDALRLMGNVYQRAGDHPSAALCFAGADPAAALPSESGPR